MKKSFLFLLTLAFPLLALEEIDLTWDDTKHNATQYNSYLQEALTDQDWWAVIDFADILSYHFATSPFAAEAPYLMGYAYYQLGHYEQANLTLNNYLSASGSHPHFQEAVRMKFDIARKFEAGEKKSFFGSHKMPKWLSAKEDAIQIYDEIIAAVPHSEMAPLAMLGKANLQSELEDYKPAVETLQTLIRRFPKQEGAAEAFLAINRIYLEQCKNTSLDLDLLELAELNLRKFRLAFPREPRIADAEKLLTEMQELFAENLFETGRFFERTGKKPASELYYQKVIAKYPNTQAANAARDKLSR